MWWMLIWWVASLVIGELLRPKPKFNQPQPSALGDFQLPTAEEGRPIPIVWGTCLCKGPNVVWYGDLKVVPITTNASTGLFSSKTIVTGYKYYLGAQLEICLGPIDELISVRFDDKIPDYTSSGTAPLVLHIDGANLYGGDDKEGGVAGLMDVYFGTGAQTANAYLESVIGATLPAYRSTAYAVMRQMYVGNSQYVKAQSFEVRRCPNQLGLSGGKHNIGGDANPACMLYEIQTDAFWALGLAAGQIDIASFVAAGNTLYDEGLGLSMLIDSQMDADALQQEILRHIDGVIYPDPETGLITLKLARADYVAADLQELNPSNILSCDCSRSSWEDTSNVVKITYTDRADNYAQNRVAQAQDLANIQARGGELDAQTINFRGLSNATTANQIAARVLKTVSYPLAAVTLVCNRAPWGARPGAVRRFTWPELGITDMVLRITRIQYGELTDGQIRIDAVEDIFGVASTAYDAPSPSGWVPPVFTPVAPATVRVLETPYYVIANSIGDDGLTGNESYPLILAQSPATQDYQFDVYASSTPITANFRHLAFDFFTPTAQLVGSVAWNTTALSIDTFTGESDKIIAGGFALLEDEWVAIVSVDVDAGTMTVKRGVLDSVPVGHADNTVMWVYSGTYGFSGLEHPASKGETVYYRETGTSVRGETDLTSAPQQTHVHAAEWFDPYPPADVKVGGSYAPTEVPGSFTITWAGRNRLTQTGLVGWTEAAELPETGCSYTLQVFDAGSNALLSTVTGLIAGSSGGVFTYHGPVAASIRIELSAARGGRASRQRASITTSVIGYGLSYGNAYGGLLTAGSVVPRGAASIAPGQLTHTPKPAWINGALYDFTVDPPQVSADGGASWAADGASSFAGGSVTSIFGAYFQRNLVYGNGRFALTNFSGTYWYRRLGGAWQARRCDAYDAFFPSGTMPKYISFDGARFILLCNDGQALYTSPDLENWTLVAGSNLYSVAGVCYRIQKVGSQYVTYGQKTTGAWPSYTTTTYVATSSDLITWSASTVPDSFNGASALAVFFNGNFYLFSQTGTDVTNYLPVVYVSSDLVSWSTVSLGVTFPAGTTPSPDGIFVTANRLAVLLIGGPTVSGSWLVTPNGSSWSVSRPAFAVPSTADGQTGALVGSKADLLSSEVGGPYGLIRVGTPREFGGKLMALDDPSDASLTLIWPSTSPLGVHFGATTEAYYGSSGLPVFDDGGLTTLYESFGFALPKLVTVGKRYAEITITGFPPGWPQQHYATFVLIIAGFGLPAPLGSATSGNHAAFAYGNSDFDFLPAAGDVIGFLIDFDSGTCQIRLNNAPLVTLASIDTTVPWIVGINSGAHALVHANVGQDAFTYSQAGYSPWDT